LKWELCRTQVRPDWSLCKVFRKEHIFGTLEKESSRRVFRSEHFSECHTEPLASPKESDRLWQHDLSQVFRKEHIHQAPNGAAVPILIEDGSRLEVFPSEHWVGFPTAERAR